MGDANPRLCYRGDRDSEDEDRRSLGEVKSPAQVPEEPGPEAVEENPARPGARKPRPCRTGRGVHRARRTGSRSNRPREKSRATERPDGGCDPPHSTPGATEGKKNERRKPPQGPVRRLLKFKHDPTGGWLVLIGPGWFEMGSPDTDDLAFRDEKPQHRVRISRPFYLGACEVTQGQFRAMSGEKVNPSKFKRGDSYPVENVTWLDAIAYCNALSRLGRTTALL